MKNRIRSIFNLKLTTGGTGRVVPILMLAQLFKTRFQIMRTLYAKNYN